GLLLDGRGAPRRPEAGGSPPILTMSRRLLKLWRPHEAPEQLTHGAERMPERLHFPRACRVPRKIHNHEQRRVQPEAGYVPERWTRRVALPNEIAVAHLHASARIGRGPAVLRRQVENAGVAAAQQFPMPAHPQRHLQIFALRVALKEGGET